MDFFEQVYHDGRAPWDTGRPQPAFVALEENGEIVGDVLDVGCGTGENALFFAERGHEVWGVDAAPTAIEIARRQAADRGIATRFLVRDALDLSGIGRTFGTVIDSGLFHVLADPDRPRLARSLAAVLRPGGTYFMLAFSDREPGDFPLPRRVSQAEIRAAFADGWRVDWIRAVCFESTVRPEGSRAWLSSISRV